MTTKAQEKELVDLCLGKSVEDLERIADQAIWWDDPDMFWAQEDAYRAGLRGAEYYEVFIGVSDDDETAVSFDDGQEMPGLKLFFVGTFEEAKAKLA